MSQTLATAICAVVAFVVGLLAFALPPFGLSCVNGVLAGLFTWFVMWPASGPAFRQPAEPRVDVAAAVKEARASAAHMRPRTLLDHFWESPIGLCFVTSDNVISDIVGGALVLVGALRSDWVGQPLQEPYLSTGHEAAMQGHRVAFVGEDPYGTGKDQLIDYSPRYDGAGEINGSKVVWYVAPEGYRIVLYKDGEEVPRVQP